MPSDATSGLGGPSSANLAGDGTSTYMTEEGGRSHAELLAGMTLHANPSHLAVQSGGIGVQGRTFPSEDASDPGWDDVFSRYKMYLSEVMMTRYEVNKLVELQVLAPLLLTDASEVWIQRKRPIIPIARLQNPNVHTTAGVFLRVDKSVQRLHHVGVHTDGQLSVEGTDIGEEQFEEQGAIASQSLLMSMAYNVWVAAYTAKHILTPQSLDFKSPEDLYDRLMDFIGIANRPKGFAKMVRTVNHMITASQQESAEDIVPDTWLCTADVPFDEQEIQATRSFNSLDPKEYHLAHLPHTFSMTDAFAAACGGIEGVPMIITSKTFDIEGRQVPVDPLVHECDIPTYNVLGGYGDESSVRGDYNSIELPDYRNCMYASFTLGTVLRQSGRFDRDGDISDNFNDFVAMLNNNQINSGMGVHPSLETKCREYARHSRSEQRTVDPMLAVRPTGAGGSEFFIPETIMQMDKTIVLTERFLKSMATSIKIASPDILRAGLDASDRGVLEQLMYGPVDFDFIRCSILEPFLATEKPQFSVNMDTGVDALYSEWVAALSARLDRTYGDRYRSVLSGTDAKLFDWRAITGQKMAISSSVFSNGYDNSGMRSFTPNVTQRTALSGGFATAEGLNALVNYNGLDKGLQERVTKLRSTLRSMQNALSGMFPQHKILNNGNTEDDKLDRFIRFFVTGARPGMSVFVDAPVAVADIDAVSPKRRTSPYASEDVMMADSAELRKYFPAGPTAEEHNPATHIPIKVGIKLPLMWTVQDVQEHALYAFKETNQGFLTCYFEANDRDDVFTEALDLEKMVRRETDEAPARGFKSAMETHMGPAGAVPFALPNFEGKMLFKAVMTALVHLSTFVSLSDCNICGPLAGILIRHLQLITSDAIGLQRGGRSIVTVAGRLRIDARSGMADSRRQVRYIIPTTCVILKPETINIVPNAHIKDIVNGHAVCADLSTDAVDEDLDSCMYGMVVPASFVSENVPGQRKCRGKVARSGCFNCENTICSTEDIETCQAQNPVQYAGALYAMYISEKVLGDPLCPSTLANVHPSDWGKVMKDKSDCIIDIAVPGAFRYFDSRAGGYITRSGKIDLPEVTNSGKSIRQMMSGGF